MTTKNESTDFEQKLIEHGAVAAGVMIGFAAQPLVAVNPIGFYLITIGLWIIPISLYTIDASPVNTALPTEVIFGFSIVAVGSVISVYQAAVLFAVFIVGVAVIQICHGVRKHAI